MIWSIFATILAAVLMAGIVAYLDAHVRAISELRPMDDAKPTTAPLAGSRIELWLDLISRR